MTATKWNLWLDCPTVNALSPESRMCRSKQVFSVPIAVVLHTPNENQKRKRAHTQTRTSEHEHMRTYTNAHIREHTFTGTTLPSTLRVWCGANHDRSAMIQAKHALPFDIPSRRQSPCSWLLSSVQQLVHFLCGSCDHLHSGWFPLLYKTMSRKRVRLHSLTRIAHYQTTFKVLPKKSHFLQSYVPKSFPQYYPRPEFAGKYFQWSSKTWMVEIQRYGALGAVFFLVPCFCAVFPS